MFYYIQTVAENLRHKVQHDEWMQVQGNGGTLVTNMSLNIFRWQCPTLSSAAMARVYILCRSTRRIWLIGIHQVFNKDRVRVLKDDSPAYSFVYYL